MKRVGNVFSVSLAVGVSVPQGPSQVGVSTHPPTHPSSLCPPVFLCGSLMSYVKLASMMSCETKTQKPVKYPAEECLTINPFISILNINQLPRGSFPRPASHLSLISHSLSPPLQPQPSTKPSVLFRDSETHLEDFQLVTVSLWHLCSRRPFKMCVQNSENSQMAVLLQLIMKRIIFRVRHQKINVRPIFFCF